MTATYESEIPRSENPAASLRKLAKDLLVDVKPESQSGAKVRKVILRVNTEGGADKLIQIAERKIFRWRGGDLWIRERILNGDETNGRRYTEIEMPRSGKITPGNVVFLHDQPLDRVEKIEMLRKELVVGEFVPNGQFHSPIEAPRKPSQVLELARHRVARGAGVLRSRPKAA